MSSTVEHDYIGLSERNSSAGGVEGGVLNLKATELRLGLPGSESPHRVENIGLTLDLLPKSFVSGAKRGFSDANDGGGTWGFAAEGGGSEVNSVKGGGLFSGRGEVASGGSAGQLSGQGNVGKDLAVKAAGQERKVTPKGCGSVGNDSPVAPAVK
ncbi:auxin-responsive protein IAA27-like [Zingiber officinale]|uniref:auxin-responsive protein IAA27-like n=1 Tax=Zingiber officinale TaxID=94328 RepID=UPI001C4D2E26|nr:auxin-responsive protein IAA27-like [Zingiber officinale]